MNDRRNLDIFEIRLKVYSRDGFQCQALGCWECRPDKLQMAHRISKAHKKGIKKYIQDKYKKSLTDKQIKNILNHEDNFITSCSIHNDSFNIGFCRKEAEELIDKIYNKIK
jgi:hypothetical protein